MPLILKRSLTILFILFGSTSLANAQSSATTTTPGAPTWTWLQDSNVIFCSQLGSISSCTIGAAQIAPTTAGSVWVVQIQTVNNVTISSVTGGGGTWIKCPNCHIRNPAGPNEDAWYNLTGNAGTTQNITVNLSGASGGNGIGINFMEALPPAGFTASYDDSGSVAPALCTTCTGVQLNNISATDIIFENPGGGGQAFWNSVSAPWTLDINGGQFNLNTTSGAAPTVTFDAATNPAFLAIAFKSTAGIFTPPSYLGQNSIVQFKQYTQTCNPTCVLTLPQATGAGNLLFVMSANLNNDNIAMVSGGGTWLVPSGTNTCRINFVQAGNNAFSCAYVLASTAGATSVSVTLNGTSSTGFAVWEIASSTGLPWTFDTQGSHVNGTGASPPGEALTITGKNDVVFQGMFAPGGAGEVTYYPLTYIDHAGAGYILFNEASEAMLLNSGPTAPSPTWINPQINQTTAAFGIAFTAGAGSALPNPPTGLTAVVH
jgi:hypothetical protein